MYTIDHPEYHRHALRNTVILVGVLVVAIAAAIYAGFALVHALPSTPTKLIPVESVCQNLDVTDPPAPRPGGYMACNGSSVSGPTE